MNKHLKGSLLIILSMIIFATMGIFVRNTTLPIIAFFFFNSLFAFVLITLYFIFKKRIKSLFPKKHTLLLALSGVVGAINIFAYYKAYMLTTMANSVLMHYTAPIFVALLAPIFLKEKIEKLTIFALILSMIGIYLITFNELSLTGMHIAGIIYGLVSGLFYGISIIVSKKLLIKKIKPEVLIYYQIFVPMLLVIPFLFFARYTITSNNMALSLVYAILIIIIGISMYFNGLKYVRAQHAGIIAYAEPIAVIAFGFIFFKEVPGMNVIFGGIFILVSGYLILREEIKRKN